MLENILNLEGVTVLNKKQQSFINGAGDKPCRVFVRNKNGGYWSDNVFSVAEAQAAYNSGDRYSDGSFASGYCCASCGSFGSSTSIQQ